MSAPDPASPRPLAVALAGLLALAVAMGIGRFAFTPLLPMMLNDGGVDLPGASWLATANYLGYWLGALGCAAQPALWRRLGWPPVTHTRAIRAGLVATVALTGAMALPVPAVWGLWRGLAGVASAVVFVYVSGWCLARLAALGAGPLAGLIYVGPGLGIAASGLLASVMVAHGGSAALGWAVFSVLALGLMRWAWPQFSGRVAAPATVAAAHASPAPGRHLALFILAYGLAGFGYIITATFLPVMARQALPGSVWLDLFWPLFGLAVAIGALLTLRMPLHWDRRRLLMGCYGLQALGVMLTVWWPSLAGFALGSALLGLPFTAITLFAMQEARRLQPQAGATLMAWLTAAYGLGQIAGPPWVAWVLSRSASAAAGFAVSLSTAAAALVVGLLLYAGLMRRS